MTDTKKYQKIIEARIAELQDRLRTVEDALDEPVEADLGDQAIELEDDEVLEGLGHAGVVEIQLLEKAQERIRNGTYGICQNCEDTISDARLDAVPYAPLCRDCASGENA